MKRGSVIPLRGRLATATGLVLGLLTSGASAQAQEEHLEPAAQAGVVLATLFAVSALIGILIMLVFALREIHKTGPRAS